MLWAMNGPSASSEAELLALAYPVFPTVKESPSVTYFSFHAPPSRSQIRASPKQLPLAGQTEILDESGFGGWVDEKIKPGSLGPLPLGAKRLVTFYRSREKCGLPISPMNGKN